MTPPELLTIYCDANNIKVEDIQGKSRKADIVLHRSTFAYILSKMFNIHELDIGEALNRDRSNVYNQIQSILNQLRQEKYRKPILEHIINFRRLYFSLMSKERMYEKDYASVTYYDKSEIINVGNHIGEYIGIHLKNGIKSIFILTSFDQSKNVIEIKPPEGVRSISVGLDDVVDVFIKRSDTNQKIKDCFF